MAMLPRGMINLVGRTCITGYFNVRLPFFYRCLLTKTQSEPEFEDEPVPQINCNKSKLRDKHYKQLHGELLVDLENPRHAYEQTVKFRRKLLTRYGISTGINPGIAWPTKEEVDRLIEYENFAYPHTIQEVVEKKKSEREQKEKELLERKKEIELKVGKLNGWLKELSLRQEKKLADVRAAQAKKDALIEEVRQHFNFQVSMKDPKFQEMYEKLEKEKKKAEKEAKKKDKKRVNVPTENSL